MKIYLNEKSRAVVVMAAGILLLAAFTSCKKFLDEKTDKQLVVPATLQDAQALLDFYSAMNDGYSTLGNISDDNYYLKESYFNSLSQNNRYNHVWEKDAVNENEWRNLSLIILNANLALETVNKIEPAPNERAQWEAIKGGALFFRGYAFYQLAQFYARPYQKATAATTPGVPVRTQTNTNIPSVRVSLEDTWQQIVSDLGEAAALLPASNHPPSRPLKQAAYGALARTWLSMQEFEKAALAADTALKIYNYLVDFNTLNAAASNPFSLFNKEVIFPAAVGSSAMVSPANYMLDSLLYREYHLNDLRRTIYFRSNGAGTVGFRASYNGNTTFNTHFSGIATDELYLIRAEANARKGLKDSAMADLNTLLVKRFKTGTFTALSAATAGDALNIVLTERRKELILRGTRWFDLRRLNLEPAFAKTLVRKIGATTYTLAPNSNRYTFLIPEQVIALTGMQQNER